MREGMMRNYQKEGFFIFVRLPNYCWLRAAISTRKKATRTMRTMQEIVFCLRRTALGVDMLSHQIFSGLGAQLRLSCLLSMVKSLGLERQLSMRQLRQCWNSKEMMAVPVKRTEWQFWGGLLWVCRSWRYYSLRVDIFFDDWGQDSLLLLGALLFLSSFFLNYKISFVTYAHNYCLIYSIFFKSQRSQSRVTDFTTSRSEGSILLLFITPSQKFQSTLNLLPNYGYSSSVLLKIQLTFCSISYFRAFLWEKWMSSLLELWRKEGILVIRREQSSWVQLWYLSPWEMFLWVLRRFRKKNSESITMMRLSKSVTARKRCPLMTCFAGEQATKLELPQFQGCCLQQLVLMMLIVMANMETVMKRAMRYIIVNLTRVKKRAVVLSRQNDCRSKKSQRVGVVSTFMGSSWVEMGRRQQGHTGACLWGWAGDENPKLDAFAWMLACSWVAGI